MTDEPHAGYSKRVFFDPLGRRIGVEMNEKLYLMEEYENGF